jgi:hypothetical protein
MFNNRWFSIAVGSGLAVLLLSGRPVLPEGLFRHLARAQTVLTYLLRKPIMTLMTRSKRKRYDSPKNSNRR